MMAGRVELRLGIAEELPLEDQSMERALALHTLHHWCDPVGGVRELHRVLKPGGRLLVGLRGGREASTCAAREAIAAAGFIALREAGGGPTTFLIAQRPGSRIH